MIDFHFRYFDFFRVLCLDVCWLVILSFLLRVWAGCSSFRFFSTCLFVSLIILCHVFFCSCFFFVLVCRVVGRGVVLNIVGCVMALADTSRLLISVENIPGCNHVGYSLNADKWLEPLGHDDVDYLWNVDRSGKRGAVVIGFLVFRVCGVSVLACGIDLYFVIRFLALGAWLVMLFNV